MVSTMLIGVMLVAPTAVCVGEAGGLLAQVDDFDVEVSSENIQVRVGTPVMHESEAAVKIIAGKTDVGPFDLSISNVWRLQRAGTTQTLEIPVLVDKPTQVRVLGRHGRFVWLASRSALHRIDVDDGSVESARLRRHRCVPMALRMGVEALIVVGDEVQRCSAPNLCDSVGRLPFAPELVISGPNGFLFGGNAGLFRAAAGYPTIAMQVAAGKVVALCGDPNGVAWALMTDGSDTHLVSASTEVPASRAYTLDELARASIGYEADGGVVTALLGRAAQGHWGSTESLLIAAATDERAEVRMQAAQHLPSLSGTRVAAALWLLGHDSSVPVRVEALHASRMRCQGEETVGCPDVLSAFVNDVEPEVGWTARDWLLEYDPDAAFANAPAQYKLDAVAILVSRLQRHGERLAQRGLEMLAVDTDVQVRAAARLALAGIGL